jgi:hypothetical protein
VDAITLELLRVASRTSAAADSLEVLQKLCGNPSLVLIAAATTTSDSNSSSSNNNNSNSKGVIISPITIGLSTGAWPQGWGLGATVSVVSTFKVCDQRSPDMAERAQVQVAFHFRRRLRECLPGKMSLHDPPPVAASVGTCIHACVCMHT